MSASFTLIHKVQFSETDLAGIVHFSNYFRWMEEVEHAFFRSLGFSIIMDHGDHVGGQLTWPRVATSCEFLGSARFEEDITLSLKVVRVGAKSLTYEVDFLRGQEKLAAGKLTSVCCLMRESGFTSVTIPADIRAKLTGKAGGE